MSWSARIRSSDWMISLMTCLTPSFEKREPDEPAPEIEFVKKYLSS